MWKELVAYFEMQKAKEEFAVEKSLGSIFFYNNRFKNIDEYLKFSQCQEYGKLSFNLAKRYSQIYYKLVNKHGLNDTLEENLEEMRMFIRYNRTKVARNVSLEEWTTTASFFQSMMRSMIKDIGVHILELLRSREESGTIRLSVTIAVMIICIILSPSIIISVYRLVDTMHVFSSALASRTRDLNRERRRTDMLLYQMLPKQIADALKKNEEVKAEEFDVATIFFSDIVGFTNISAKSSPVQVIQMLDNLYTNFDEIIEQYEVYKVETIGDAYMCASGVPRRNGQKHVSEIAKMAIEILDKARSIDIAHMPGKKFQMRIGIHTGNVVAGVVGVKMPRYCLFGETVNIASALEALSLPNRIHVSHTTHDLLIAIGGFTLKVRTSPIGQFHNDRSVSTVLKRSRTYWLMDCDSLKRPSIKADIDDSLNEDEAAVYKEDDLNEDSNPFIERRRGDCNYPPLFPHETVA